MSRSRRQHREQCLTLAARTIVRDRNLKPDGSASFSKKGPEPDTEDIEELLAYALDFKPDVPSRTRVSIVTEALFELAKADEKDITANNLLKLVESQERTYRRKRKKRHFLHTQISIDSYCRISNRLRWGASTFSFYKRKPRLHPDEERFSAALKSLKITDPIPRWYYVNVFVDARDDLEAADNAYKSLNLLRAIWNLQLNRGTYKQRTFPTNRPLNKIRLGPIQTTQLQATPAEIGTWWYQRPFIAADYLGRPWSPHKNDWESLRVSERRMRTRLRQCNYSDYIQANLINYVSALDTPNYEESFRQLWGVLESLTGCGRAGVMNYDTLVRRASNVFNRREEKRVILTHLRSLRNRMTHDLDDDFGDASSFMLIRVIHGLFHYHLHSCTFFRSVDEFFDYLDLPTDKNKLKRSIQLRDRALDEILAESG